MKILYLTDQIYLHGGIEKVLSQKANYLADVSGDEVYVVTYNQQKNKPVYTFSNQIKFFDLNINYEILLSYFHPKNLKKVPKHRAALKNILKEINPDVVVSCHYGPDFYFLPFLEKQIPKIKEFHSSRFFYQGNSGGLKDKILKKLGSKIEKKYNQLVVLNDSESEFYANKNIAVIPNPAEITEKKADYHSKKIMAAGRISPVKNFGELITIFSRLAKDFPDWELHFYGENYSDMKEKLTIIIKKLGLEKQIKFKNSVTDLKKIMCNYSIYAMTSHTECFPMVLLESLSVGIPVISYDAPTGPKHIIKNNEDSFLIPNKNLDIFTAQLKILMQDENLRKEMGAKARGNVRRFAIDLIMQKWKNMFDNLTSNSF